MTDKKRYMLKDIRRQLTIDRETYFSFGQRISLYFWWNKKTLDDVAGQKAISIDADIKRIGVKPADIEAVPFRRLTDDARAAVTSFFKLTDQEIQSAECTIRPCGVVEFGTVMPGGWVMDVMNEDVHRQVFLSDGDVTDEDEKHWRV